MTAALLTITGQFHQGETITAQALDLTGDGHGRHVAGTPDVYRHGWIPLDGTEIGEDGVRRPGKTVKPKASGEVPQWIRTKGTGGIGMSPGQAAAIAAEMNTGHFNPHGSSLSYSVDSAIGDWANGYGQDDDFPDQDGQRNMARLMMVVAHAGTDTPALHRGLSADTRGDPEQVKVIQKIAAMQPGDTLKAGKPASWSDTENVAREFAGTVLWGDGTHQRIPSKVGVMLKTQQGSHALSIGKLVPRIYQDQNEWVAPPNAYEVISNDPHPDIPGMRVLTVREAPS